MANADEIMRTVEPGSLPQGERQAMASRLQQALPKPGGGGGAPTSQAPASSGGAPNPLSRLLGGGYSSDLPVTDGLSVGPGAGPARSAIAAAESPKIGQLRMVALEAKSPLVRYHARMALRREVQRANAGS